MRISKLNLLNYRNFKEVEFSFSPTTTLIVGNNGQGKTNILESVYYLSTGKSFRSNDRDLINFNAKNFLIRGEVKIDEQKKLLASFFDHNKRKIFKVNQQKTPHNQFIGHLKTVLFSPEDVKLVVAEPFARRSFLDTLITQIDKSYNSILSNYKRILHQRNHVLYKIREGLADVTELEIWNVQLIKEGSLLILKRAEIIELVNKKINQLYRDITGADSGLLLNYLSSVPLEEDLKTVFYRALFVVQERDLKEATTHVGPHRDDFEFSLDGRSAAGVTSRGEQRAMVLALKLSELQLVREINQTEPVLLLDDVYSEFDDDKKLYLSAMIKEYQSIITTASPLSSLPSILKQSNIITLEAGRVNVGAHK